MSPSPDAFSRLILFRPRPEFPLPHEWNDRKWIPLGDLRPLLQAISPVRDLSDHWRWAALPMPREAVQAVLADTPVVVMREAEFHHRDAEITEGGQEEGVAVICALLVLAAAGQVERVELSAAAGGLLGLPSPAVMAEMLRVATALRRACGCVAVGL
jgi:hypothetical protein